MGVAHAALGVKVCFFKHISLGPPDIICYTVIKTGEAKMILLGGRAYTLEHISEIAALGLDFAEICLYDPDEVERNLEELLALKDRLDITYLAHYPNEDDPMNAATLSRCFVPRMQRLLALSAQLGIPKGTLHFWMDRRLAPPDLLAEKIVLLKELVAAATDHGHTLCIENLTERHESFAACFCAVENLRMTLDIGHGNLLCNRNTAFGFIDHCYDHIAHVHVHDNNGGTTVQDDLHLPLGEGTVDYPTILSLLAERGYQDTVTMEVPINDMPRTREAVERYLP